MDVGMYSLMIQIWLVSQSFSLTIDVGTDMNLDFCSEKMLAGFKADGEDAEALFDSYIKLYNDCLSERPADFHVSVHLCRGNFVGSRQ
jgi:methionine synthase II (cobalamin-independent)